MRVWGKDWLNSKSGELALLFSFPCFHSSQGKSSRQMALTTWEPAQSYLDPKPAFLVLKGKRRAQ